MEHESILGEPPVRDPRLLAGFSQARPDVRYLVGLDIGKARDYTALAVAKQIEDMEQNVTSYHVRHLLRFPLRTPYLQIVARVARFLKNPELRRDSCLVVDNSGVGAPIVDALNETDIPVPIHAVTIVGGDTVTSTPDGWRVPKTGEPEGRLATSPRFELVG